MELVNFRGQQCVLKRYTVSGPNGAQLRGAVEAEIANLQQLVHPNVIRLDGYFYEEDTVFVQLEYIEGGTLADWMRQRCALRLFVFFSLPPIHVRC